MDIFPATRQQPLLGSAAPGQEPGTEGDRFLAQIKLAALRNDANFNVLRTRERIERELANQVRSKIPPERLVGPRQARFHPKQTLRVARELALEDPELFEGIDISPEAIETRLNDTLKAERDELEAIIAMSPEGGAISEFLANMIGATADIKNVPFLFLGGGGSVMRVIAREAALNATAEGINMPQRFDVARRLKEPDPNVAQELAAAAAFGGILGGGAAALSRGLTIFRDRGRPPATMSDTPEVESLINQVEDEIALDRPVTVAEDALERAERVRDTLPKEPPDIAPTEPLETPAPQQTPQLDRDSLSREVEDARTNAETEIRRIEKQEPDLTRKAPFTRTIIRAAGGVKYKRKVNGEMVLTPAADQLAARGITPRTHPFLFRKDGHEDLDNLVASEIFDTPGIFPTTVSGHLDPEAIFNAIADELGGVRKTFTSQSARDAAEQVDALNASVRETDRTAQNLADLDDKVRSQGVTVSEDELAAMVSDIRERGMDADEAFERMAIRDVRDQPTPRRQNDPDFDDIPFDTPTGANDPGAGTGTRGGSADAGTEAGIGARAGAAEGGARFEETQAGQQQLIPGVDPISPRDRLQDQAGRLLEGGNEPLDIGLFDTNSRAQQDMFSDPSSKAAVQANRAALEDLRGQIDRDGDFEVELEVFTEDGNLITSASDLLRFADEGIEFADIADLCGGRT